MRIAIIIIVFMVAVGIPVGGAILNGWDWQTWIWYILVGALGTAIGIDRLVSWMNNKK